MSTTGIIATGIQEVTINPDGFFKVNFDRGPGIDFFHQIIERTTRQGWVTIVSLIVIVISKILIERSIDHKRRERAEREKARIRAEEMKDPNNQK